MKNDVNLIFCFPLLSTSESGPWIAAKTPLCFMLWGKTSRAPCSSCQPSLILTHLCDFLPSVPPGPEPQSWAWMMKVYSFCSSQSTRPRALSWPSPDVPFSTTASNGASSPWMLNAQISPGGQKAKRKKKERHGSIWSMKKWISTLHFTFSWLFLGAFLKTKYHPADLSGRLPQWRRGSFFLYSQVSVMPPIPLNTQWPSFLLRHPYCSRLIKLTWQVHLCLIKLGCFNLLNLRTKRHGAKKK